MAKSSFSLINRKFGEFMRSEMKRHFITVESLRKHCHFDHNAFSEIKRG